MNTLIQLFLSSLLVSMSSVNARHVSSTYAAHQHISDGEFILDASETSRDPSFRSLQASEVFEVPLLLSMQYLNNKTASELESKDPKNMFVHSLCSMVQRQAGGNQVNAVVKDSGISVKTAPVSNISTECVIVSTQRVNTTTAALGRDYFSLHLSISQLVYVTSARALNLSTVQRLVENGFNRGYGGRAVFLSLMRGSDPAYNLTLVDVIVLPVLIASPTVAPSTKAASSVPTIPPTLLSTRSPTLSPSGSPILSPSESPTLSSSGSPSLSSSGSPVLSSSGSPTMMTSTAPSTVRPTLFPSIAPSDSTPSVIPTVSSNTSASSVATTDSTSAPVMMSSSASSILKIVAVSSMTAASLVLVM